MSKFLFFVAFVLVIYVGYLYLSQPVEYPDKCIGRIKECLTDYVDFNYENIKIDL